MDLDNLLLKVQLLEERIENIESEIKVKKKKEIKKSVELEQLKVNFFDSKPEERTDLFDDWELVLYASLLYNKNVATKERISSMAEIARRASKIKNVVDFFESIAKETNQNKDWARRKTKEYIEYIITVVTSYKDKTGVKVPIGFYLMTSDTCLNQHAHALKEFEQKKKLAEIDKELE